MLSIRIVTKEGEQLDAVKELFREYLKGLNEDLCFQQFDEELENPLKKYGGHQGCLLLAYWNNGPVGCIALQAMQQSGVCEMKRLFVSEEFRSKGIGDRLVKQLIEEAMKRGYRKMVLDTLKRLKGATALYLKHGFVNTSAYYPNPLKNVVYMEKSLPEIITV